MKYIASLTREELLDFISNFYLLDLCLQSRVAVTPGTGQVAFTVTLKPNKIAEFIFEASFRDGLLSRFDWSKKFKKQKSWWS